jgi:ADP-ribose pyrophosphatase
VTTFRVVDTTTLHQAGFLSLVEARVEGPDGDFTRWYVRHPGAVVAVPIERDRATAVLVRQFRVATGSAVLEVPAGKRDVAGEPLETTAARELEEEIACRPGRLTKLCEFYNSPGFCDEYTHLFVALDLEPLAEARATTAEEAAMSIERVPLDDVEMLIAAGEIVDAKTIVGLLLARRFLDGDDTPGSPDGSSR